MNNLDELLRRDREAGVPEPPEVSYTAAAVRRRLAEARVEGRPAASMWPAVAAAVGTVVGLIAALCLAGVSPVWLLLIPAAGLAACPILLKKGAGLP